MMHIRRAVQTNIPSLTRLILGPKRATPPPYSFTPAFPLLTAEQHTRFVGMLCTCPKESTLFETLQGYFEYTAQILSYENSFLLAD